MGVVIFSLLENIYCLFHCKVKLDRFETRRVGKYYNKSLPQTETTVAWDIIEQTLVFSGNINFICIVVGVVQNEST